MTLPGMVRGISGGGSRCTSPPGGLGAARRGVRLNCSVLTGRNNLSVSNVLESWTQAAFCTVRDADGRWGGGDRTSDVTNQIPTSWHFLDQTHHPAVVGAAILGALSGRAGGFWQKPLA